MDTQNKGGLKTNKEVAWKVEPRLTTEIPEQVSSSSSSSSSSSRLCLSTAGCSPPSMSSIVVCLLPS